MILLCWPALSLPQMHRSAWAAVCSVNGAQPHSAGCQIPLLECFGLLEAAAAAGEPVTSVNHAMHARMHFKTSHAALIF